MTELSFDIAKYNELFEKMKKTLQKQGAVPIYTTISIPMSSSALQLAQAELGYAYAMAREARDEEYRTKLMMYGCTEEEAHEVVRLCQKCAERSILESAFNSYFDYAISALSAGETVDELRYHLYQTSMSNRQDEFKTDKPDDGFFK
jgi:hypothetical protein